MQQRNANVICTMIHRKFMFARYFDSRAYLWGGGENGADTSPKFRRKSLHRWEKILMNR